jgi:SpoVK/Ycf46/Vps4 family AAA+-type ATPase
MKSILIIGMTGTGKTTEVKNVLKKFPERKKYIYDVNNEYSDSDLPTLVEFLEKAKQVRDSIIVFEEATIFFSNRGRSEQVIDLLVRKRHTNNIIVFVFHSIRSVPTYIFEMSDHVYLKRTNDTAARVKKSFDSDKLLEVFEVVEKNSKLDPYYTKKVKGSDL